MKTAMGVSRCCCLNDDDTDPPGGNCLDCGSPATRTYSDSYIATFQQVGAFQSYLPSPAFPGFACLDGIRTRTYFAEFTLDNAAMVSQPVTDPVFFQIGTEAMPGGRYTVQTFDINGSANYVVFGPGVQVPTTLPCTLRIDEIFARSGELYSRQTIVRVNGTIEKNVTIQGQLTPCRTLFAPTIAGGDSGFPVVRPSFTFDLAGSYGVTIP